MSSTVTTSTTSRQQRTMLGIDDVGGLLDTLDEGLIVAERNGQLLMVNRQARRLFDWQDGVPPSSLNLFSDLLKVDGSQLFSKLEGGGHKIEFPLARGETKYQTSISWTPGPDWLTVKLTIVSETPISQQDVTTQLTVQELLQEREITYRNLLAAYLKLQEVNRQKTVFLASAAHELKTPLAVIKGYYDLLLTGSLGRLSDKQRDILEESKDSCERLVRLVSMFLNYSALESGKLVLQLRENDLRDCLEDLAKRWSEAFQRKNVKLDMYFDPSVPTFKFDYQKVQQAAANLLDNSLKHTPAGGSVTLRAAPHFWERRVAENAPSQERRRFRLPRPNSVEISVSDSGPGIAAEHHQEIFEDFVRVDRNTSGMGLGLAIAKRLIQAHRGKIWVESEPRKGSTFTFLLPMDQS
ncbi:MAG TPA: HAMP domain-containing sensor histidine kinase [Candidatus Dormibacteraeota bacterium]|nr:HAMP domain-containing sensor histidine kinase [Candidatus Dormibacteraeota bacterium]